jgi:hypothetical protein
MLNYDANTYRGIDVLEFGELLMSSGLVLMDNVTWISFHRYACLFIIIAYAFRIASPYTTVNIRGLTLQRQFA